MSSNPVIQVEHLSKEYRLGTINHGTLHRDLQSWWARIRGKPDPNAVIREHEDDDEADDLNRNRERFLALNDVSFEVEAGETFGIIGRNGAGKSTLLKVLCRVTAPTAGRARIRGRIASLLEVGTGFHPELTGQENVYLNGAILGMTRAEIRRKFDDIVDFSQLARFIDTPVKRYSSGMYVRLAFSVAAHLDAEVLIVDEVLAVGDYEFQKKCIEKLRDVTAKGRTVLLVSHNMSAVQNLCSRAILLRRGRLVGQGETSKVVESYIARPQTSTNQIPLAQRQDRNGNGMFRFVDARVDPEMEGRKIETGANVLFKVWVEKRSPKPVREVDISIAIDDYAGTRVANLWTRVVGRTIDELPAGRTLVEFEVPRLPLAAGRYSFNTFGSAADQVADWVQSAGFFEVQHGDFFGTGRTLPPGNSVLVSFNVHLTTRAPA